MATNWGRIWQSLSRRDFLRKGGALTGLMVLAGAFAEKAAAQVPPPGMPPGGPGAPPMMFPGPVGSPGQADFLLSVFPIKGDSKDAKHKDWIDIESYSLSARQQGGSSFGGGGGAGKVIFQDIHFVAKASIAGPQLMLACATGEHFKQAILIGMRKPQQQEFLKVTLTDVLVSSYQTGSANDAPPVDQFSINFGKIEYEYKPQNPDGSMGAPVKSGWDVGPNKKL